MKPLTRLTIDEFREGLEQKKFSALDVTQAFLSRIETRNPEISAYLRTYNDSAVREAEAIDVLVAKGGPLPPLAGVPIALKDNILVEGRPATAASKMLKGYVAPYSAGVTKKLRAQGAVILGHTNMDEFAMGSSTENSAFQTTKNPHDLSRVPGGTSGGSAAAVADHMAMGALGSDTGGSVRQPAAFCGVVGLKTTYGSVSRSGLIAMASSLDQIGPLAQTTRDASLLFRAIAGRDPLDATSADTTYGNELTEPALDAVRSLKVGLPREYFTDGLPAEIRAALDHAIAQLKTLGVEFVDVSLPHTKYALSAYYIVMPAEASSNLARFDGIRYSRASEHFKGTLKELYFEERGKGFGPEVKRRILLGTFVLSSGYYDAYYTKAQQVRALIAADFEAAYKNVDVLLAPVAPHAPWHFGAKKDPLTMYLEDIFTLPASLAGIPSLSIPTGVTDADGLPIGFQLMGKHFREADILGLGQYYEKITSGSSSTSLT